MERTPRTLATLVLALLAALGLAAAPSANARNMSRGQGLDAAILARMNAARAAHGLGPLRRNAELPVAAR